MPNPLRRFHCLGSDGNAYFLPYQDPLPTDDAEALSAFGLDDLRLADGRPVSYVHKGRYQLMEPPVDLVCDYPDAP